MSPQLTQKTKKDLNIMPPLFASQKHWFFFNALPIKEWTFSLQCHFKSNWFKSLKLLKNLCSLVPVWQSTSPSMRTRQVQTQEASWLLRCWKRLHWWESYHRLQSCTDLKACVCWESSVGLWLKVAWHRATWKKCILRDRNHGTE